MHRRAPFDRMLVAQAPAEGLVTVTKHAHIVSLWCANPERAVRAVRLPGRTANCPDSGDACAVELTIADATRQTVQSSIESPATRPNSPVLFVTSVASLARAVAAIIRSLGPISLPWEAKSARIIA